MNTKTNYTFHENNQSEEAVILTHGLTSSIEGASLESVREYFISKGLSILSIDMYAHGLSEGTLEDFTLSKVYQQIQEGYSFLENKGFAEISLYGVSISALPIVKVGLEKKVKKVFLRVPAMEMYAKRSRELGVDKMKQWKKEGKISIGKNYKTGKDLICKYDFILDLLENFHRIDLSSEETQIFIGAGINDDEVLIDELTALDKQYPNVILWPFEEGHNFSKEGINDFLTQINKLEI